MYSSPSIICPADFKSCPGGSIHPNVSVTAIALKGGRQCDEPIVTYKDILVKAGNCVGASLNSKSMDGNRSK
ncbi:MAG: hypothetical protein IPG95_00495 [Saprospiraceae bacterium]|nr:hypothetical protein [Saprospiraceae bacterium]